MLQINDKGLMQSRYEPIPLEPCNESFLDGLNMIPTPAQNNMLQKSVCMKIDTAITGFQETIGTRVPVLEITRCEDGDLPEGESCMDDKELEKYLSKGKKIKVFHTKTFVDYEDIETPMKSIIIGSLTTNLEFEKTIRQMFYVQSHEFHDMTQKFQIGKEPQTTEFLSIDTKETSNFSRGTKNSFF